MNSRILVGMLACLLVVAQNANAQSDQYKRKKKSAEAAASAESGDTKSDVKKTTAEAVATSPADTEKKVDITDLEQRYWAPKDEEFRVVQNRTYSKEKRFAASLLWGPVINDSYTNGSALNVSGSYFFSERYGVELNYSKYSMSDNDTVSYFYDRYGVVPDHNIMSSYYGAAFSWVPVYAKLSLLEKQIIYFDMSISPGLGFTQYKQQVNKNTLTGAEKNALTFSLDLAQHFFLSKNFALRLDLKNRIYNEEVVGWNTNQSVKTKSTTQTMILFGFTYYH